MLVQIYYFHKYVCSVKLSSQFIISKIKYWYTNKSYNCSENYLGVVEPLFILFFLWVGRHHGAQRTQLSLSSDGFGFFFLSFGSKTEVFHPPQSLFTEKVLSVCCTSIWISQEFLPKSRPVYLCKNKTAVIFKRFLMWLYLKSTVGCYFKENKFILTWACALGYSSVDKTLHGHLSWRLSVSEISLIFHSERKMHQTCNVPMMCEP